VVDQGSFTAASRALGIPKSKLSRRLAALEERLDVRLLQRSTRRLTVTEIGHTFHTHCKAMLAEAEAAEAAAAFTHLEPRGALHVSCPIALLHLHVGPMLVDFAKRYPLVKLQVTGMNRPVDVLAEGIDLALRMDATPPQDSDLALRVLGESPQILAASPRLVRERGQPKRPEELQEWPTLGRGALNTKHLWTFSRTSSRGRAATLEIVHLPRFASGDLAILCDAAQAGLGVVQLPLAMAQPHLQANRLVQVLPHWSLPAERIHALFASRRGLISSVRALIEHLARAFQG
ncbi:MAG: LysR substrate-binding domain-containing protein, partial [Firmicutes bacterium]|nr:LysR substrate-binding domain-containing protein [Bacillota bacterium]